MRPSPITYLYPMHSFYFNHKYFYILCAIIVSEMQCSEAFSFNTEKKLFLSGAYPPFLSHILELILYLDDLKPSDHKFQKKNLRLQCRYWNNSTDIFIFFFHFLACFVWNLCILMLTKLWEDLPLTFSGNSNKK
jgi:hypothetical protein